MYHLNAEEERETYCYPDDPEFHERYGSRGVTKASADGTVEDTGPLNRKRMETVDEELAVAGLDCMGRAHEANQPFFVWMHTTRMHVWTRLREERQGVTGVSIYADGMVEHDSHLGLFLDKIDELGIADNTIVVYSTDNGAQKVAWADGGTNPFNGEKGTTNEGGFRAPLLVRWPGVIEPVSRINALMSHEDWMPTLLAAAGVPDVVEQLKEGYEAMVKTWRIHADGYNFMPFFKGEAEKSPRETFLYFSSSGTLNAIRWNEWKLNFAKEYGDQFTAARQVSALPEIVNLSADPYETAPTEAGLYVRWMADNMWLIGPAAGHIQRFVARLPEYPFQRGMSNNPAGLNYNSLGLESTVIE